LINVNLRGTFVMARTVQKYITGQPADVAHAVSLLLQRPLRHPSPDDRGPKGLKSQMR